VYLLHLQIFFLSLEYDIVPTQKIRTYLFTYLPSTTTTGTGTGATATSSHAQHQSANKHDLRHPNKRHPRRHQAANVYNGRTENAQGQRRVG